MALSQSSIGISFIYSDFKSLKKWLIGVVEIEEGEDGDIEIIFTSDEYLIDINRKFLKKDYYTDVICFDYCEGKVISGDILISIDSVRENAKYYNVDFQDELDRVILHGVLHLLGYKDSNDTEKKEMRSVESYYLKRRSL